MKTFKFMVVNMLFVSVVLCTSLCVLCSSENEVRKSYEVLTDLMFTQGFVLTGATHKDPVSIETFGLKDVTPAWRIAQWNSKSSLDRRQYNDHFIVLEDDCKSVTVDRKSGAINLTVHASKEYTTPRVSSSEPWVHLLLEQSTFQRALKVADVSEIWVEVEFELTENKAYGEQDPSIHAAQLSWFLYLKNTNSQSKGFHDFVWFGLSMFDSRYDFVPDYALQDFAMPNGSFIFTLGSKHYFDKPVEIGKRKTIRRNIKSDICKGIETAHQYGFINHTTIHDVALDGTNIGWEVPGVYDVGVTIYKMNITVIE